MFLEPNDFVYEVTTDEDGWMTVKTENGEEGEIPISCTMSGIPFHNVGMNLYWHI